MSGFDPGTTMDAVDHGADRLEHAADVLYEAIKRFETAEEALEKAEGKELVRIFHEAQEMGDRPPAEDIRKALARGLIDPVVYQEYLEAKVEKEGLGVRFKALTAAVSARQSVLKALSGT